MGPKLPYRLFYKTVLFTVLLFSVVARGTAQTTLGPGDLAIVAVNTEDNANNTATFSFVPLVDLEAGTPIKFTDAAYLKTEASLETNEGTVTYTAPDDISAGSLLTYTGSDDSNFLTQGNFKPRSEGDNIIAFQDDRGTPHFLYGISWGQRRTAWEYDANLSESSSDIPSPLGEDKNTILNLSTSGDFQYNMVKGARGTPDFLLSLIGEAGNWKKTEVKLAELKASFNVLDTPTVAFSTDSMTVNGGKPIDLFIELVESGNTTVNVDVVFVDSLSTVENADIGNYSAQTISFSDTDEQGSRKAASVNLSRTNIEDREKVVFRLQNISKGNVSEPRQLTLTVLNNSPDIVVNEFLTNSPSGITRDVNNDDRRDGVDDEFVEIVNNGSTEADISGWQLSNDGGRNIVHRFPEGTVLSPSEAIVVFGGGEPTGNFGGALIQTSSNGGLNFDDRRGLVTLLDDRKNIIQNITYSDAKDTDVQSVTRDPDVSGNFVKHSQVASSNNLRFSPGTKATGSAFGANSVITIQKGEGWRLVSTPSTETTFKDLFENIRTQGIAGSDLPATDNNPSVVTWDEQAQDFVSPSSMSERLKSGKGYAVYLFKDDDSQDNAIQENVRKIINSKSTTEGKEKAEKPSTVNVTVTAHDRDGNGIDGKEGWNLLGNPFGTEISVNALFSALESANENINKNIYVWDPAKEGGADYVTYSPGDDETLSPFQAFWVRYTKDGIDTEVSFKKKELTANQDQRFLKSNNTPFGFSLDLYGKEGFDTYEVEFSKEGSVELDRYDAYELFSLNTNSINLYSTLNNNKLAKNVLPEELESILEIPIHYNVSDKTSLTFEWDSIEELPADWDVLLVDQRQGREINLRSNSEYRFDIENNRSKDTFSDDEKLLNESTDEEEESRFILRIRPGDNITQDSNELPESAKLKPNYPNPFSNATTIPFELAQEEEVTLTVWNMIGQKVATLVDDVKGAGEHTDVQWDATNMPSGMYIARFEVAGQVFTRKMTLIK